MKNSIEKFEIYRNKILGIRIDDARLSDYDTLNHCIYKYSVFPFKSGAWVGFFACYYWYQQCVCWPFIYDFHEAIWSKVHMSL